jgi:phosphoribosylamine--glycine ligase/phosphoribosylaminoimidazole synthetase
MRILVLGSGGREDAIAWSLEWSADANDDEVFVAPGNAGSSRRLSVDPTDAAAVIDLCAVHDVELVVVGPESVVEAGVTDALVARGLKVFGPSRAAGRLETSKGFCREFAHRHGIPSPSSRSFSCGDIAAATRWADEQGFDVVVKADGLAAGKGVVVPESIAERDAAIVAILSAGDAVLEQRLIGDEVSVLVFTDGTTVRAMPPARDHKRICDADQGPNTGGMGAFAPTRSCPPDVVQRIIDEIVQPAVDGMRADGTPYVGVLYAGVMLTTDGPRLIEFNCRFGDPEAQVLLPLLTSSLKDVMVACVDGRLADVPVVWSDNVACTVVLASRGYPSSPVTGDVINGLDRAVRHDDVVVFHAGTELVASPSGDTVVTAGGRVLDVVALGPDLDIARGRAYAAVADISFEGCQYRRDIGWRELARHTGGYAASGVDIDEGSRAVELMKASVSATHGSDVLAGVGSFGGVISLARTEGMAEPVLVASTDGVGTKVMLAAELGRYDTIGHDIVNHCVDDILVQGARPLFFLDYVASSRLSADMVAAVVSGMAEACRANNCALLGGETAEMPGVYAEGHFDVAGTIVGVADRTRLLPRRTIAPGDVLVGIASSGLHTNGYSLVRRIFAGLPLDTMPTPLTESLGDALLAPHRSYLPVLDELLDTDLVKGMAHITGGGLFENLPRILPAGCAAQIDRRSWPMPPLFALIAEVSGLPDRELFRTFNMGVGMVLVVDAGDVDTVQRSIAEDTWVIGSLTCGDGEVHLG